MTTTRTIADKTGSLQLFIENSWSASDIIQAKRRQLGLLEDHSYSHRLFVHTLTATTLAHGKNLAGSYRWKVMRTKLTTSYPAVGRQVAIDGGARFSC